MQMYAQGCTHCMCTVPMSPGYDVLNVSVALADLLMEMYLGIRHFPSRDLVTSKGCLHPCRQASFFLPCARPPDVPRLCFGRPRNHQAAYVRRAFVLTRLTQTPEFTRCHLGVAIAATPMMFLSLLLELLPADFVTDDDRSFTFMPSLPSRACTSPRLPATREPTST
jgi:hypothetical protein